MADSGAVVMPANNALVECIAPMAVADWRTLQATGNHDIQLFVYTSGTDSTWSDDGNWIIAKKLVIGREGVFYRIAPTPHMTIRAQGPEGETCRVTVT